MVAITSGFAILGLAYLSGKFVDYMKTVVECKFYDKVYDNDPGCQ